jgi:hypothetical protein
MPVEARYFISLQTWPGAHPSSYTMGTRYFQGVKRPERGLDNPPHLAAKLKKEKSYNFTPPLGLNVLFYGELYLYQNTLQLCPHKVTTNSSTYRISRKYLFPSAPAGYLIVLESFTKVKAKSP